MLTFIKKDLLLFWRDRKEVLIVIILPLILVLILSISMAGLFGEGETDNYDLSLGLVNEDALEEGFQEFKTQLRDANFSKDVQNTLIQQVEAAPSVEQLTRFLNSSEISEWIDVEQLTRNEAKAAVDEGKLDAMLIIPEGYSAQLLASIYLNEKSEVALDFQAKEIAVEVDMLHQVIQSFIDQMNLTYTIATTGQEIDFTQIELPGGGIEKLEGSKTFTIDQYFTISMGVLFVLFLASTVASRTGVEKREQTFNRIALTNTPANHFLFGKTFATFTLAWLQMMIIFIGSHLILGVFAEKSLLVWTVLIWMAILYSLSIAGISAMLTSISLRLKNPDVADGIFMIIVMLFGFLGGNFVPIQVLPAFLQQMGEFTPNGLTLAVLLEYFQFEDLAILWIPSFLLLGVTVATIAIGMWLYPKRGEVS